MKNTSVTMRNCMNFGEHQPGSSYTTPWGLCYNKTKQKQIIHIAMK